VSQFYEKQIFSVHGNELVAKKIAYILHICSFFWNLFTKKIFWNFAIEYL